jgi:hypothetical protein
MFLCVTPPAKVLYVANAAMTTSSRLPTLRSLMLGRSSFFRDDSSVQQSCSLTIRRAGKLQLLCF